MNEYNVERSVWDRFGFFNFCFWNVEVSEQMFPNRRRLQHE